jgi:hypothetical protein
MNRDRKGESILTVVIKITGKGTNFNINDPKDRGNCVVFPR